MGLSNRTRLQLQAEGITDVLDLAEWKKEDWDQFASNCKRPDQIPDPANPGVLIHQQPFALPVKSLHRLKVAAELVRHYERTNRVLSAANMRWNVCKNFDVQFTALVEAEKKDSKEVPKLSNTTPVPKWADSFKIWASESYGSQKAPLGYVIRDVAVPPNNPPDLAVGQPHSASGGSILADLTSRLSHASALYARDDAAIFSALEEATRGTKYANAIKPYESRRDGRSAYLALLSNHAGDDKWDAIWETAETYVTSKKWDGSGSIKLEDHIDRCRASYVDMESAAQHVNHQQPTEYTKVKYFLSSIEGCSDPGIQAAISAIRQPTNNMLNSFQRCIEHIRPVCPVSKRMKKRKNAQISATDVTPKSGIGKTGVELRYHKDDEWWSLTEDQRDEVRAWRKDKRAADKAKKAGGGDYGKGRTKGGKKKKVSWNKQLKGKVATLVKKKLASHEKQQEEEKKELADVASALMSLVGNTGGEKRGSGGNPGAATNESNELAMAAAVKLNQIVKKKSQS